MPAIGDAVLEHRPERRSFLLERHLVDAGHERRHRLLERGAMPAARGAAGQVPLHDAAVVRSEIALVTVSLARFAGTIPDQKGQANTDPITPAITHGLAHDLIFHPGTPLALHPGGAPRSRGTSHGPWRASIGQSTRAAP